MPPGNGYSAAGAAGSYGMQYQQPQQVQQAPAVPPYGGSASHAQPYAAAQQSVRC
jgi:hypothetical protein